MAPAGGWGGLAGAGLGAAAGAGGGGAGGLGAALLAAFGLVCALGFALRALGGAVVTGATDGIGRALALGLAARGFPVCVVSRTPAKLEALCDELHAAGAPEARAIRLDFGAADAGDWTRVRSELAKLDVGVLVNNVGQSYAHAEYLHNLGDDDVERLIRINCSGTVRMTKIALEGMVARRQRSAILNIGSGAAT